MRLQTVTTASTVISLLPPISEHYVQQHIDTIDRASSDSASSNGTSPTTPYYEKLFAIPHSLNNKQFGKKNDDLAGINWNEGSARIGSIPANDYKYNQHRCRQSQKNQDLYVRSLTNLKPSTERNEPRMHVPSKKTIADENYSGVSITQEERGHGVSDQETQNGDDINANDFSSSIDSKDFPNPPSFTPSFVQGLTIKTNIIPHHYGKTDKAAIVSPKYSHKDSRNDDYRSCISSSTKIATTSRFTEVFNITGTYLELDYNLKYRHHHLTSSSSSSHIINKTQTPSIKGSRIKTKLVAHHVSSSGGQNTQTGNFINSIGRTMAPSSTPSTATLAPSTKLSALPSIETNKNKKGPLSASSSINSIRGLIRSLSTTTTNRYHTPISKLSLKQTRHEVAKAAQIANGTTATSITKKQQFSLIKDVCTCNSTSLADTEMSIDDHRRRKLSSLFCQQDVIQQKLSTWKLSWRHQQKPLHGGV